MGHGQSPGLVHPAPEGGMQDDPPVPRLVGALLHHEPPIRGNGARAFPLGRDERPQVAPGILVQSRRHDSLEGLCIYRGTEHAPAGRRRPLRGLPRSDESALGGPHQSTAGATRLVGAPDGLTVPEGQPRRPSRRRLHDHTVGADLLDAPGTGAKRDDVTHPRFHHHLLVELPHAPAPLPPVALGQHHREHAPIGNSARRGYRQPLRTGARLQEPRLPIPQDARSELGDFPGPVAAGQHIEDALEGAAAQIGVAGRAPHRGEPRVGRQPVGGHGHGGHGLLGQHV